jgi:hypothetical protein
MNLRLGCFLPVAGSQVLRRKHPLRHEVIQYKTIARVRLLYLACLAQDKANHSPKPAQLIMKLRQQLGKSSKIPIGWACPSPSYTATVPDG